MNVLNTIFPDFTLNLMPNGVVLHYNLISLYNQFVMFVFVCLLYRLPQVEEDEDINIKRCPMCHIPIERDEGCAQMMCKRCKHVFCWYCLANLDVSTPSKILDAVLRSRVQVLFTMYHTPNERDKGCTQMMCKQCKHVFCWYCLANIVKVRSWVQILYSHVSQKRDEGCV